MRLTVTDDGDNTGIAATRSIDITITVDDLNRPPELPDLPNRSVAGGETLEIPLSSVDPDGNALRFTATATRAAGADQIGIDPTPIPLDGSSPFGALVFDEDDALAVEQRLRADGFDAEVVRERLQGEDDDEDHPWAVLTDAPSLVADVLADEFDGWLDEEPEQPAPRVGSPLDLPTAPRRIKRTDA